LDTLSRAHDIDAAQPRRQSLLAASSGRWNGADTKVYARGMVVAFLCDVALLSKSRGKRSVEDLARDIYQAHKRPSAEQDGNTAVLGEMAKYPELAPIVDGYVKGSGTIDWAANLAVAGIEPTGAGRHSELKVRDKPGSRQKALLDKLGYNSWRKLSGSSK
jgi:predicted metalloprotease with PDZ domain